LTLFVVLLSYKLLQQSTDFCKGHCYVEFECWANEACTRVGKPTW